MRKLRLAVPFVFALCILLGAASVTLGDWDPNDPHKMHYPQLPKTGGLDVAFNHGRLADDWQCSQTGPVKDIHFWISWEMDMVGPINGFSVRIWSDDPCGPGDFSQPDTLLWERDFDAGQFTVRDMPDDMQGWFDPLTGYYALPDHFMWQQINITEITNPHTQLEGEVYWLEIDMWGASNCGWKQSGSPHFRDDAVYWQSGWRELIDPTDGQSMDLAFVITGGKLIKHLKWSQPPIPMDPNSPMPTYCGWDEISYNKDYENPNGPWKIVADDFYCLGLMPIDSIHWWGSHQYWEDPQLPPPASNLPTSWWVGFWSNTYTTGTGTKADVLFLTDTTGSMSGYINNFKTALSGVLTAINNAAPGLNIMYSVADYRNYNDGGNYQAFGVNLIQPFTANIVAVQAAINGMSASGGDDWAESQLTGMVNIAGNWTTPIGPIGFNGRAGAKKIIIWAGDAHGHIAGDEPGSSGFPRLAITPHSMQPLTH